MNPYQRPLIQIIKQWKEEIVTIDLNRFHFTDKTENVRVNGIIIMRTILVFISCWFTNKGHDFSDKQKKSPYKNNQKLKNNYHKQLLLISIVSRSLCYLSHLFISLSLIEINRFK